jgi:hypothetical protein
MLASFKVALQKGSVGERIIKQWLEAKRFVVYQPTTDCAHAFDMLAIRDKTTTIALDVKSKAAMNKLPATGVDYRLFEEYQAWSKKHSIPFWLMFVDEGRREVYGNWISKLEEPRDVGGIAYPYEMHTRFGKRLRLWPLAAMEIVAQLKEEEVNDLAIHNQRNYAYEPVYE